MLAIHFHVGFCLLAYANLVNKLTLHTLNGVFTPANEKILIHVKHQPSVSIFKFNCFKVVN
jgi:hypothetical protein